uniref:Pumpkin Fruit Chymotrypsin Inhibitor n=1 Tax=Cucurbita maxima TaxID=3661 RepID=Q43420_CUCMA|nr:Pumpkin Fruit Chymotrypsin Inhibitor [Cucurbita maxima]
MAEKSSWPELVGEDGEEAVKIIQQENPSLDVILMPRGQNWATLDCRPNRVRVFNDESGKVNSIPRIG